MSANTTMWDIVNTKANACSYILQLTKCKIITCLKRHRKIWKHGENCKYQLNCEFRHDQKSDTNVTNQISELKNSIKELSENKVENEKKLVSLEKNAKEIKDCKQQMSDCINKLSAKLRKVKKMCKNLKSTTF